VRRRARSGSRTGADCQIDDGPRPENWIENAGASGCPGRRVNAKKPQWRADFKPYETTFPIFGRGRSAARQQINHEPLLKDRANWEPRQMRTLFKNFASDNSGATSIEYGLIASLVALVIIAGVTNVGTKLTGTFNKVSSNLH
jgi:pilus assembly protein Flp/PilA